MKEAILNNIYGHLYRTYDRLHEKVDTDGSTIWVDIGGKTYAVTVAECEKEVDTRQFSCTYTENNVCIECDLVSAGDVSNWFKDSFRHHTGKEPTESEVGSFQLGIPVIVTLGNLCCEWCGRYAKEGGANV